MSQTTQLTVRAEENLVDEIDILAQLHGFSSRNSYIVSLLEQAVEQGYSPSKLGEGLRAISPSGGTLSLIMDAGFVSSGYKDLLDEEISVFETAKTLAEQSQWHDARQIMRQHHFRVEYIKS